jgi:flagellar motor protein MotB
MKNESSRHHKSRPHGGGGVGIETADWRTGLTRFWVLNRQNSTVIPLVCDSQRKAVTTL